MKALMWGWISQKTRTTPGSSKLTALDCPPAGRGSIGGSSRLTSTRPRIQPRGPRPPPAWGLTWARGPTSSAARAIRVTSEPQDHLAGQEVAPEDASAVPSVVLERRLQDQV